jgi:hypothetical protein
MKTRIQLLVVNGLTLCAALWAMPGTAHAQIFVANPGSDTIGEYNLDGTTVNASLVSGLNIPEGIAVSGGDLFVVDFGNNTIGEYTTAGATVNASLVTGLDVPFGIDVEAVPEPSTWALLAGSLGGLLLWRWRTSRTLV